MGRGRDSQLLEAESLGKSPTGSHMLFPIFPPGVSIQLFIFLSGGVYVTWGCMYVGSEVNFMEVILRYLSMCSGDHTRSAGLHCNHLYTICNHIFFRLGY